MEQLIAHKSSHASAGNGYFCIFDNEDIKQVAETLRKEGKLELIRTRNVSADKVNASYTVYKRADDE